MLTQKMIVKRMKYRDGEGLISNIQNPTLEVIEVDCSEMSFIDLVKGCKPCKETFLRMEGPEIKQENDTLRVD